MCSRSNWLAVVIADGYKEVGRFDKVIVRRGIERRHVDISCICRVEGIKNDS